ncbi:hypothetical protein CRE_19978 [Caenorhabditis remanei]|uniref:Uncharacterized protein n=1 Tax=Caenorhabditis remanei TaxID=31234 RepID=E3N8H1_CAERE|nr:hypothetical protein CRE_19978 [Caenorhabditis remanei]
MRQDKGQVEKLMNTVSALIAITFKQLDGKIVILCDQLDGERRRRREYVNRFMVNVEREKRNYDETVNNLYTQSKKIKYEVKDFRNDAENKIPKKERAVHSEAKASETNNTALKAHFQADNDRIDHLESFRDMISQDCRWEDELSNSKRNLVQKEMCRKFLLPHWR